MPDVRAIILAGGQGARFWPVSRQRRPKQFLCMGSANESLIQATARRANALVGKDNISVVTNSILAEIVLEHVPNAHVIVEPFGRNTSASIGLAAIQLRRQSENAVMLVLPADHAVSDERQLLETWREAADLAAKGDHLVTIGIQPTRPDTAYGYIRRGDTISGNAYVVRRFFEKPNLERAMQYLESGDYFWNSGMFVWRVDAILRSIQQFMPLLHEGLLKIDKAIGTALEQPVLSEVFEKLDSISIDFGILELAQNCAVVLARPFGWNDVGSWDAWAEHFQIDPRGNLLHGDALAIESCNCIVHSPGEGSQKRLTALLGVENLVVIDAGDSVLICPRDRVQDVKRIVDVLKQRGRTDLI